MGIDENNVGGHKNWTAGVVLFGLVLLYLPTLVSLHLGVWQSPQNSQGPIILLVCAYLLWKRWPEARPVDSHGPNGATELLVLSICVPLHAVARANDIAFVEMILLPVMLAAGVSYTYGIKAVRPLIFPLVFLLFAAPLPGTLVDALTKPLKLSVSIACEYLLSELGLPVARQGVIIFLGPYQLLVADACAGLNSMFTLEALGFIYLNIVQHASAARNSILAVLIIPISFCSNVIRVLLLAWITLEFGDQAGQGFAHSLSGIVLFLVALGLIVLTDSLIRRIFPAPDGR
jgi:exosortase B